MPIRRVGGATAVQSVSGFGSGTRVKRVTVGRPISNVIGQIDTGIKRFDGLGDIPSIEELKLGEIGINTQDGKLYIKREYDGGVQTIVEIGAVGDGSLSATTTFNAYIYTSDGTLEVVSGEDDKGNVLQYDPDPNTPSRIQVYLNGVLLHQGIDYTADDGVSITLTHVVGDEQVVQVAAYNSTGVSFGNDLILDDHYAFIVGTNEETRLYHNGTDTILKHLGFDDSQFKIQYQNDNKFVMDDAGVQLIGDYTLNGQSIAPQPELDATNARTAGISTSTGTTDIEMLSDVNMSGNKITNIGNPTELSDLTTKQYVDDAVAAQAAADTATLNARIDALDSDLQEVTELLQELLQFRQ